MPQIEKCPYPDERGIVYSGAAGRRPFSVARVEDYIPIVGEQTIERLVAIASKLKGMTLLELNSSAKGGGVAEMLFSSIPLLDQLGINVEWMVIGGSELKSIWKPPRASCGSKPSASSASSTRTVI